MTWLQELRDLGAAEISQRLGGKPDGEWWRLPYLCKGQLKLKTDGNPGFKITRSGAGWIRAYCHHCEQPSHELLKLVYDAVFGRRPDPLPNLRSDASRVPVKTGDDIVDELGSECLFCGEKTASVEVVNGWPLPMPCDGNCYAELGYDYDDWIKLLVERFNTVRFTSLYHSAKDEQLESVRVEPGKNIWGKGSNSKLLPLPLLWPADVSVTANGVRTVVIVEGEKAAAGLCSHGYDVISWRGGKGAWKHTNWDHASSAWRPFNRVILWPDGDEGSRSAFYQLGVHLPKAEQQFDIVDLPEGFTEKESADAADFTASEVDDILTNHTRSFSSWASEHVSLFQPTATPEFDYEDEPLEDIPYLYRKGGYYDVERMLKYLRDDLAYIQTPTDRGLTTSLAWADNVGYWHLLHEERNFDRLATAISEARLSAGAELFWGMANDGVEYQPSTLKRITDFLESMPTRRDLQEAAVHLTTALRQNELHNRNRYKPLPQYSLENRRIAAADGLLTFKGEVISLPSQSVLRKADVREYGLVFDEGWSDLEWKPGACNEDTPAGDAVRTLLSNLGDLPIIVAEMLAGMDRRIAILHSKTSGVGKSMFTALLKTSLGSLVETTQPGELTKRAMGSQFPNLNNHLTRCRVLVIPEVNTVGLENVNFAKLVHLTGETHLTTERKYMEQVTLPRTGNVLLTMGEVQKRDPKGNPLIEWDKIQGLFDESAGDGRLRVWDVDVAGGTRISPRHFNEALSRDGQLAFVDWLVQMMGDGRPDSRTPAVLDHINILFNTSRDTPTQSDHYSPQLDKADAVIRRMTEWTEGWYDVHDVCDLALVIENKLECEEWQDPPAKMTDQSWLSSIRRVYNLPSMRALEVEGSRNQLTKDRNGRRNWPVRGFRFKVEEEYGDE